MLKWVKRMTISSWANPLWLSFIWYFEHDIFSIIEFIKFQLSSMVTIHQFAVYGIALKVQFYWFYNVPGLFTHHLLAFQACVELCGTNYCWHLRFNSVLCIYITKLTMSVGRGLLICYQLLPLLMAMLILSLTTYIYIYIIYIYIYIYICWYKCAK